MYTIGQFSVMTKIPTKTLRYYDEINLLKPAKIDEYNSYRYYDDNSIQKAQQILIYRSCNLSLEKIKFILDESNKSKDLLCLLESQFDSISLQIDEMKNSQSALKSIISELKTNNLHEVLIKEHDIKDIISIRERGNHDSIGNIISKLYEIISRDKLKVIGPHTIIWHEDKNNLNELIDMEIYIPIENRKKAVSKHIKTSKQGTYCEIKHNGSMITLSSSYKELYEYITQNNYEIVGPFEETYVTKSRFYDPNELEILIKAPVKENL